MPEKNDLSDRELEILSLVATGASNKEIAQSLVISTNTVKVHLKNIFNKIGAASRTEAAMYAIQLGLVQAPPQDTSPTTTGEISPSQVAAQAERHPRRFWQAYAGWIALAAILILGLGGALAIITRSLTSGQAAVSPQAPGGLNRWQMRAEMPTPRLSLAVAAYENQIYAIAGETENGVVGVVERYDPATDGWTSLTDKPLPVSEVTAALLGGNIYIPGGRLASGEVSNVLDIYNPRQDSWEQGTSLPVALSAYGMASFEGKLYVFGGWDGNNYLDTVYVYDSSNNSWSQGANMPTARGFAGAAVADGKIFVIGGTDGERVFNVNEVYQPILENNDDNPWSHAEPMPDSRYAMGVTSVAHLIEVVGGTGELTSTALEYSSSSDSWFKISAPGNQSWSHLNMTTLASYVYAIGGTDESAPSSRNLSYEAIYTLSIPIIR